MAAPESSNIGPVLRSFVERIERLEEEKKATTKALKDRQDTEEASARAYAQLYKNGFEERETKVIIGIDKNRNVRSLVDIETGREIGTEMLQDSDMQTSLNLQETRARNKAKQPTKAPAEPEAKPAASGVLEIGYEAKTGASGSVEVGGEVMDGKAMAEVLEGIFDEVKPLENASLVSQVFHLEEQPKAAPGVLFVTTAEERVFFTDNKEIQLELHKAKESRAYVEFKFIDDPKNVNHQLVSVNLRDSKPYSEEDPEDDLPLPDGLEDGDIP